MKDLKKTWKNIILLVGAVCIITVVSIFAYTTPPDSVKPYIIGIDSLDSQYYADDEIVISGNTTLPAGDEIRVHFYQSSFIHGRIRPNKTSIEIVTDVLPGESGNNRWTTVINTTGFWPGENVVMAYSNTSQEINASRIVILNNRDKIGEY